MHNTYLSARFGLHLALAAGLLIPSLALATSHGTKELKTAITHVGLANEADTPEKVQMHLQHAVNCLVGEQGEGFDDSVGNPCKGLGQGAIDDVQADESVSRMLEQAAALARIGTRIEAADAGKKVAQAVEVLLQEAKQHSAAKS